MIGIAYSLIPASVASTLVNESENGIKHTQIVKGISKKAYWLSYALVDLVRAYCVSFVTIYLISLFEIGYPNVWMTLVLLPLSIVPQTYVL